MRKISWWGFFPIALAMLASGPLHAQKDYGFGDEDPIPWACVDFSGNWKSDAGGQVQIEQRKCGWLKLKNANGLQDGSTVIVPDDKVRTFADDSYRGAVRYRWNSRDFGSVLETSRVVCYSNRTVEEYVTLEQVSENLLLETTYRTTTMFRGDVKVRRDVKQQQLRRKSN